MQIFHNHHETKGKPFFTKLVYLFNTFEERLWRVRSLTDILRIWDCLFAMSHDWVDYGITKYFCVFHHAPWKIWLLVGKFKISISYIRKKWNINNITLRKIFFLTYFQCFFLSIFFFLYYCHYFFIHVAFLTLYWRVFLLECIILIGYCYAKHHLHFLVLFSEDYLHFSF